MSRYERFIQRARAGEPILIDGGTGSEVLRRGVPETKEGWSGMGPLYPDIVTSVHEDYLALGAQMIASCTFSTGKNICADVGKPELFAQLNRDAVTTAVAARDAHGDDDVLVAAGISNWSFTGNPHPLDELLADTLEQATIMRDAGADLISLEMMVDIPRMTTTLDAVSQVGLPIWVGFSVGPEEGHDVAELADPIPLRDADLLVDAVEVAAGYDVDAMFVMHTDTRLVEKSLLAVASRWDGPLGAYAHSGELVDGQYIFEDTIAPGSYASYVPAWRAAGATIIGGCCGIGPEHMAAVVAKGIA